MSLMRAEGYDPAVADASSLAEEQRDVARARIVRAARKVLADRGLATTIDDVAEAAGVSRRTVFRHFATREGLIAVALREGLRSYAHQIPPPPDGDDVGPWLLDVLLAAHRLNAGNGRIYWELSALEPELTGELAAAAAERRERRKRFAANVTSRMWAARGGRGKPPRWLFDTVAVHLSGFTTQSLAGDFGRKPDDVARVSARVLEAALTAALAEAQ
jgi:AcrR family transcriptional regulator